MDQSAIRGGRLFLAAVPDADAAARIFRLARALKQAHRFPGKLIEPECLHVSLFFLGEFEEQLMRIVCDAAAEVRAQPFDIWFDRSASFLGRPGNRPFVLIGDKGLEQLRSQTNAWRRVGEEGSEAVSEEGIYPARHAALCRSEGGGVSD